MPRHKRLRDGLNEKQMHFVQEYLISFNAAEAARNAGYSKLSAKKIGFELLEREDVQSAIREAIEARARRTEITQDQVLREYAKIAFGDIRDIFGANGELLFPRDFSDGAAGRIAGIEVILKRNAETQEVERVAKVTTTDKLGALNSLAKHLGMFTGKGDDQKTVIVFGKDDEAL
ncbi:terminase small subunit [Tanticharoenia sakaeratensis]|uniref:Phage terminase small subunit n=1 Tax=Tanticharoenia sakaeratensis NBRC 103193 TaxID=1231623 RepID=A0A0D6MPP5_9PROT|nr:terminase small subunit [Tanticharoenia sakaeratensis]GAN55243.1 phage terminase small subunit [Tanticharoenia sakaeratensis NBRC 103193]GBQ23335.1 phage terminase small subunit [Tanticharoenia sakaeratensis NBRC 103193]